MVPNPLKFSMGGIIRRVAAARHVLVLLDYDGTLAPYQNDPGASRIPAAATDWLAELARHPKATVGIVSGRSVQDLAGRVGLEGLVYAGNHGIEVRGRGLHYVEPAALAAAPILRQIVSGLAARLSRDSTVLVEDKHLTATVHVGEGQATRETAEIVHSIVEANPQFRCRPGRRSFDILPENGWDKGSAVRWIRQELGLDGAEVVYVGDDSSDEDAFAVLPNAITVKIGEPPTHASYVAESPIQVWALLAEVLRALDGADHIDARVNDDDDGDPGLGGGPASPGPSHEEAL